MNSTSDEMAFSIFLGKRINASTVSAQGALSYVCPDGYIQQSTEGFGYDEDSDTLTATCVITDAEFGIIRLTIKPSTLAYYSYFTYSQNNNYKVKGNVPVTARVTDAGTTTAYGFKLIFS